MQGDKPENTADATMDSVGSDHGRAAGKALRSNDTGSLNMRKFGYWVRLGVWFWRWQRRRNPANHSSVGDDLSLSLASPNVTSRLSLHPLYKPPRH